MFWGGSGSSGTAKYDKEIDLYGAVQYKTCDEMLENTVFIPMRLTQKQRKGQRIIAAAVSVSDYTDRVDNPLLADNPDKRSRAMLLGCQSTLKGMQVAGESDSSFRQLLREHSFESNASYFQHFLELARRYKIMNPDLMRSEYPKFVYLLQDALREEIQEHFGFCIKSPIITIYDILNEHNKTELLNDPLMKVATTPVPRLEPIRELNKALRRKDLTVKKLIQKYSSPNFSEDLCEICIRSIDDANCYVRDNAATVDEMILLLRKYFKHDKISKGFELGITEGKDGSRLTHDHEMQWKFVLQSLTLWRNVSKDMFRLWHMVEQDLLDEEQPVNFRDTGQGFNRVQQSKRVYHAMVAIVDKTKAEVGDWVGSDRVHIGDDQVPNGMVFLDKYTQVNRIINPILRTLTYIDRDLVKEESLGDYIEKVFGGSDALKKQILHDFFQHGFDGSGGDNMLDAGSCIDGRLTSAWNWCQNIKSKPYYPIFLLSGFSSFDGEF